MRYSRYIYFSIIFKSVLNIILIIRYMLLRYYIYTYLRIINKRVESTRVLSKQHQSNSTYNAINITQTQHTSITHIGNIPMYIYNYAKYVIGVALARGGLRGPGRSVTRPPYFVTFNCHACHVNTPFVTSVTVVTNRK